MKSAVGPAGAPFGLAAIGQIAITVSDVASATQFYRDKLGMRLLFEVPNMAFFDCDGVRLMLSGSDKPAQHDGFAVYFKTQQIERAHAALLERGIAFERDPHLVARMPDHELWMAFLRDPDGNLLALMSEKRPAA